MKKIILSLSLIMLVVFSGMAQTKSKSNKQKSSTKVEVLYFKADLACCAAKACNNLEGEIKSMVEKNNHDGKVTFSTIKISDKNNESLVNKYNAKSQTVVLVTKKKNNESSVDVSDIVRKYVRSGDKATFEQEFLAKLNESLK